MAHFIHVVTLALSLIYLVSGKGYISSDLSFDCASNGSMMIFVNNNGTYGSIYAVGKSIVGLKNTTNTTCPVQKHIYRDSFVFEITGCDTKETVSVIVMHSNLPGSTYELFIGGQGVASYQLKCNEVPIGGYTINKTVNLNESVDEGYTPYTESPFELTMEIKDKHSILKLPVIIGYELHLVISGKDGFDFRAETCIASDGSHTHNKTLMSNGSSVDTYILSNFNTVSNNVDINVSPTSQPRQSLEAILYAFHFVDSYDVEIMCMIIVCQRDDESCSLTRSPVPSPHSTMIPNSSPNGRRRRDALGLPQTQTLRTTFRVVDQFGDNDGSVKTSGAFRRPVFWLPLAFLTICVVRTLM